MSIVVVFRVTCDVFLAKKGSSVKKKCGVEGEWEGTNFFEAWNKALAANWRFDSTVNKAMCPTCGPEVKPYLYGRKG